MDYSVYNVEPDYDKIISMYKKYCSEVYKKGGSPVSFSNFVSGKY